MNSPSDSSRNNKISCGQLMCLLIITRLVSLMLVDTVSLRQLGAELGLSALLSFTAFMIYRNGLINNAIKAVSAFGFFALCVLDTISYFRFTTQVAHPEMPVFIIATALAVFTVYSGFLGTEPIARYSSLALIVSVLFILIAIQTNLADVRKEFFLTPQSHRLEALALVKCLDAPLLFLFLAPDTKYKQGRALLFGNGVAYLIYGAVFAMCRAVLGRTAYYYKSPVFALFQLGEAGSFTKLDILYFCAVLVLLFAEISLAVSFIFRVIGRAIKK